MVSFTSGYEIDKLLTRLISLLHLRSETSFGNKLVDALRSLMTLYAKFYFINKGMVHLHNYTTAVYVSLVNGKFQCVFFRFAFY